MKHTYTVFIRDGKAHATADISFQKWYINDGLEVLAKGLPILKAKQMMRVYNRPAEAVNILRKFWKRGSE